VPAFAELHAALLESAVRPFAASFTVKNVVDPTDLVTLVMTIAAVAYLDRRPKMSRMRLP